jgi:hypothetical protein
MWLTKVLQRLTAGYLAPSEQISFLCLCEDDIKDNRSYWINQAKDVLKIDQKTFDEENSRNLKPSERYLQLYTEAGFPDYGSGPYADPCQLDEFLVQAMREGNLNLLADLAKSVNEHSDPEMSLSFIARQADNRKYLSLIPFNEDQLVALGMIRAISQGDHGALWDLFSERDRERNSYFVRIIYNEAIRMNDCKMIEFIAREIAPPTKIHLYNALEKETETFRTMLDIILNRNIFKLRDWQTICQCVVKDNFKDRISLLQGIAMIVEERIGGNS